MAAQVTCLIKSIILTAPSVVDQDGMHTRIRDATDACARSVMEQVGTTTRIRLARRLRLSIID